MRPRWLSLSAREQVVYRATISFLEGRLEEKLTIDWAIGLKKGDEVKKLAIGELTNEFRSGKILEPWRSAWKLIIEAWDSEIYETHDVYETNRRLASGDRSSGLIDNIVSIVRPTLEISAITTEKKTKSKLKFVADLLSASLSGAELISPDDLAIGNIYEKDFLISLASSIEATLTSRLELARRIGWDGKRYWKLGGLNRAYYVANDLRDDGAGEPDSFAHGIAPSVKLLYMVVERLAEIDLPTAINFSARWKTMGCPIHLRLWAAFSRDPRITPSNEVSSFLLSLDQQNFWDIHNHPEFAELRAVRFKDLSKLDQKAIVRRIRNRPPRNFWPSDIAAARIESGRLYFAIRELRRIQIAGGELPQSTENWVNEHITQFNELVQMTKIDEGFLGGVTTTVVHQYIDNQYDLLAGEERLKALDMALSSARGWNDNQAEGASSWVRKTSNTLKLLVDFETSPNSNNSYERVWKQFGEAHSPSSSNESEIERDLNSEATRALTIISTLSDDILRNALEGLTRWLSVWTKTAASLPTAIEVWLKLWPLAVETTNAQQPEEEEPHLSVVAKVQSDREPMDLDTLNTPVGRLVGFFLGACPNLTENAHPFAHETSSLSIMRDTIFSSTGRSLLIAQHRLVESLSYFLQADQAWARNQLIAPLMADSREASALWRAIARRTQFRDVLEIIGDKMIARATDQSLGRETRRSLVFSLIIECLHALNESRPPVVERQQIMQMIRSLDDEMRAYGAEAVQRFIRDLSKTREGIQAAHSPEQLFESSAKPFLEQFWPQERSLATPGVSKAFADLPATTGESFADAVTVIERFLVPFDCWSMMDYGLYGTEDDKLKLAKIDTPKKASAFLHLLNLTVGSSEGAVIPHELGDALDQIRTVAPDLSEDRAFRRLAAAARR